MRFLVKKLFLVSAACLFASCTAVDSFSTRGASSSDETTDTPEAPPTPIAGTNLVDANNFRVRCNVSAEKDDAQSYNATCKIAVKDSLLGQETLALGIKPGTRLVWLDPSFTFSSAIKNLVCEIKPNQLQQNCLFKSEMMATQFATFSAKASDEKSERTESDKVNLSFKVSSFGIAPQINRNYFLGNDESEVPLLPSGTEKIGYQNKTISRNANGLIHIGGVCQTDFGTFMASENLVFMISPDKTAKLVLGSPSPLKNSPDNQDPSRIYFKQITWMSCAKDKIFISDEKTQIILDIHFRVKDLSPNYGDFGFGGASNLSPDGLFLLGISADETSIVEVSLFDFSKKIIEKADNKEISEFVSTLGFSSASTRFTHSVVRTNGFDYFVIYSTSDPLVTLIVRKNRKTSTFTIRQRIQRQALSLPIDFQFDVSGDDRFLAYTLADDLFGTLLRVSEADGPDQTLAFLELFLGPIRFSREGLLLPESFSIDRTARQSKKVQLISENKLSGFTQGDLETYFGLSSEISNLRIGQYEGRAIIVTSALAGSRDNFGMQIDENRQIQLADFHLAQNFFLDKAGTVKETKLLGVASLFPDLGPSQSHLKLYKVSPTGQIIVNSYANDGRSYAVYFDKGVGQVKPLPNKEVLSAVSFDNQKWLTYNQEINKMTTYELGQPSSIKSINYDSSVRILDLGLDQAGNIYVSRTSSSSTRPYTSLSKPFEMIGSGGVATPLRDSGRKDPVEKIKVTRSGGIYAVSGYGSLVEKFELINGQAKSTQIFGISDDLKPYDCGIGFGELEGKAALSDIELSLRRDLSRLCIGTIVDFDVKEFCSETDQPKSVNFAVLQRFGYFLNVVEFSRPCLEKERK